ncbi:glycosyltransferase family 2 protein [Bartonella sp. DGB2]|uniref:glycosyltransferase family 2 protein n=1 Tax=Bartonella sp. DGB2 TaxID=3388426 RepID=UPI00398FD9EE
MSISVLTLNKNRHDHLNNLIIGLERNSEKPYELIIVEMSDPCEERDFADGILAQASFPINIVPFASQGLPLSAARNLAAAQAGAEKLLFLDVDCIACEHFIVTMERLISNEGVIISPMVYYLPERQTLHVWSEADLLASGTPHEARSFPRQGLRLETNPGLFWSLAFGLYRKTFANIGGFCEAYQGYGGEDTDFGYQAADQGVDHYLTSECYVFHQYHPTYDPPFNHFDAIIANAQTFFRRWQRWPMEGWLQAFAAQGFIDWRGDDIIVLARPTSINNNQ